MSQDKQPDKTVDTNPSNSQAQFAEVQWRNNGLPFSPRFDDFYFSLKGGLEETRYIFIEQNRLAKRWQALSPFENFVVAETGFGTGLNFLACWKLWNETAPSDTHLHFISTEKYPLRKNDLSRALALWPELEGLAQQLLDNYPKAMHHSFHRLTFTCEQNRSVTLTLIIDDVNDALEQLQASKHSDFSAPQRFIDAWFLDGFTPAKNTSMWQDRLFATVAKLSRPGTTLATFAAASIVKKGLRASGFKVETLPGFGIKREMVRADFVARPTEDTTAIETPRPKRKAPPQVWHCHSPAPIKERSALIIGGGIAGCHSANALAKRGWQVTLLEQHSQLATEGSGNPQGVLYGKLSHRSETLSDFNLFSLQYAERFYAPLVNNDNDLGALCGVLQTSHSDKTDSNHEKLVSTLGEQGLVQRLNVEQASEVAGIKLTRGGLFFPDCGWLTPAKACEKLIDHDNITVISNCRVDKLDQQNGQWLAHSQCEVAASASIAIICNANAAKQLEQSAQLPLKPVRGQVSYLAATDYSRELKTVLCGEGYIAPVHADQHCLGATFDVKSQSLETSQVDHRQNLEKLQNQYPQWLAPLNIDTTIDSTQGRAGLRCTTPDYLPLVGPVPKFVEYLSDYSDLRRNAKADIPKPAQNHEGLYVNVGYGSRGIAYTPLCAELLASLINNEPYPVAHQLQSALHPGRFIIRDLMRGKI